MKRHRVIQPKLHHLSLLVTVQVEVSFCWKMSTNHNKKRKKYITTTTTTTTTTRVEKKQKTHTYFLENQNSIIFQSNQLPHHSVFSPFCVGPCSFNTKLRPMKACQRCRLRGGAGDFTVGLLNVEGDFLLADGFPGLSCFC